MNLLNYITERETLEPKKLKEIAKNTKILYKDNDVVIELDNVYSDRVDLKEKYGLLTFNSTIKLDEFKKYITTKVNRSYIYELNVDDIDSNESQDKLTFIDLKLDIMDLFKNELYYFDFENDVITLDYKLFDLVLDIKQSEFGLVVNNITKTKHEVDSFNVVNNDFFIELGITLDIINKNKELFNNYFNFCLNCLTLDNSNFKIVELGDVFKNWISDYLTLGKQECFVITSYIRNVDIKVERKSYSTLIEVTDEDGNILFTHTTKTTNLVRENLIDLIEKIYNFI